MARGPFVLFALTLTACGTATLSRVATSVGAASESEDARFAKLTKEAETRCGDCGGK